MEVRAPEIPRGVAYRGCWVSTETYKWRDVVYITTDGVGAVTPFTLGISAVNPANVEEIMYEFQCEVEVRSAPSNFIARKLIRVSKDAIIRFVCIGSGGSSSGVIVGSGRFKVEALI